MPRTRKTQTGAPAQEVKSVPGRRYGEGDDQQAMQAALPAPNVQQPVPTPSGPPPGAPLVEPGRPSPDAVQAFLGQHNPNLLAGTDTPDELVTEGLSSGPGRGAEAIRNRPTTPLKRFYENLAAETGNVKFRHLAERAGL